MDCGKVVTSSAASNDVEEGDFFFVHKGKDDDKGVGVKIDEHRMGMNVYVEVTGDGFYSQISVDEFTDFLTQLKQSSKEIVNQIVRLDGTMEFVCIASPHSDLFQTDVEFEVFQQTNGDYWAIGTINEDVYTIYSKGEWDNRKFVYKKTLTNGLEAADYKLNKKREKERKGYILQPNFRGFNPRTSQFY
jgi:hypothetical protein